MQIKDRKLTAVPWLTPEVIDFITNFLAKIAKPNILEFGSGCSTIFFASTNPANLISVEHSATWFRFMQDYIADHDITVDLRLIGHDYYQECNKFSTNYFDFILLDGKDRMACLQAVRDLNILKPGGVVMLDDADLRDKYQVADDIMQGWQKLELSGWKQNPLHLNDAPAYGVTKCWFRPEI